MKKYLLILLFLLSTNPAFTQRVKILNDLKQELSASKEDTTKVKIYADISYIYGFLNEDSCYHYINRGLDLARQIDYEEGKVLMFNQLGNYYLNIGDLPQAMQTFIKTRKMATEIEDTKGIISSLIGTALLYSNIDSAIAKRDMLEARQLAKSNNDGVIKPMNRIDVNLGIAYLNNNQLDTAFFYLNGLYQRTQPGDFMYTPALAFLGAVQAKMGHINKSLKLLNQSVEIGQKDKDYYTLADSYYILANIYSNINLPDSAIWFAEKSYENAALVARKNKMIQSAELCSQLYEPVNLIKSHEYLKIANELNNEIFGAAKIQKLQKLILEEQEHQLKLEQEQIQYRNRLRLYLVSVGLIILAVIAFILYRSNLQREKINSKLESALEHLKSTQSQLIQAEKMASLGELTAGIAHEIQNPLNFVNNFSDLNKELIDELKEELAIGKTQSANEIADDIKNNEEKINHHGKRAEAIVKGMLLHSRGSSGKKEPTDINALCDEYLRLSYHGFRAKDKSFNADFNLEADEALPQIDVVPQDIGRVLLNLINNAFYAVNEKVKQTENSYKPLVVVQTGKDGNNIIIKIKDNGPGIPESVKKKIFQPFFTTKPTGQGTGLGLSLSYDIVKAHGGELKVESKENEGTEFSINIPVIV